MSLLKYLQESDNRAEVILLEIFLPAVKLVLV